MAKYEILETKDYDMFVQQPGNRLKSKAHIQELINSFEKHRHLRIGRPVIINRHNQVVDGQHSLDAAREMDLPVYYVKIDEANLSDTRIMNSTNRSWALEDFIRSWARERPKYQRILEIHEEYPLPYRLFCAYLANNAPGGHIAKQIRTGEFTFDERKGRENLEKLADFSNYISTWSKDSFALAINYLLRVEGYDHDRMLKKLELRKESLITRGSYTEYLRDLETIYNKGAQKFTPFLNRG